MYYCNKTNITFLYVTLRKFNSISLCDVCIYYPSRSQYTLRSTNTYNIERNELDWFILYTGKVQLSYLQLLAQVIKCFLFYCNFACEIDLDVIFCINHLYVHFISRTNLRLLPFLTCFDNERITYKINWEMAILIGQ